MAEKQVAFRESRWRRCARERWCSTRLSEDSGDVHLPLKCVSCLNRDTCDLNEDGFREDNILRVHHVCEPTT